jgi:hypothetical protein
MKVSNRVYEKEKIKTTTTELINLHKNMKTQQTHKDEDSNTLMNMRITHADAFDIILLIKKTNTDIENNSIFGQVMFHIETYRDACCLYRETIKSLHKTIDESKTANDFIEDENDRYIKELDNNDIVIAHLRTYNEHLIEKVKSYAKIWSIIASSIIVTTSGIVLLYLN